MLWADALTTQAIQIKAVKRKNQHFMFQILCSSNNAVQNKDTKTIEVYTMLLSPFARFAEEPLKAIIGGPGKGTAI